MDRTAANYKLKDSLSFHNHIEHIDKMKKYPFSISMDKCTSNSNERMFSTLVNNLDEGKGGSVVQHYESIDCKVVNAENLFVEICKLFTRNKTSFNNLVSDVSDNTNYIRGEEKWP